MAAVFSSDTSLSIETNWFWKYFNGVEDGFGSTLRGWRLFWKIIPEFEEGLIGSIDVGSWLKESQKIQIWSKELTVSELVS